ncbi:hypothetical protein TcasGA2_TC004341 [Tribolium castaneum]|uniref:CCHC-type domain-containing protein n=1 Tax=Tribolium castaneum TaxID=7070 RepID=D7ELI4_TRICA|nr:hypothetical protein TcasGA2_TC004341 [Tribolium castaneum]
MTEPEDIIKLKNMETISVSGMPTNPSIPEDKALRCIVDEINRNFKVISEFICSSKDSLNKRVEASIAASGLHSNLNDISRLYTISVTNNRTSNNLEEKIKDTIVNTLCEMKTGIPTYAQIATSKSANVSQPNTRPHKTTQTFKVLVYPNNNARNIDTSEKTKIALTKTIKPKDLNFKVDKIIPIRNNGILIESPNKEIEQLVNSPLLENSNLNAKMPNKIFPKILIKDVANTIAQDTLSSCLKENVEEQITPPENWLIRLNKFGAPKNNSTSWIAEIHPIVWKLLINKGKLYCEETWTSYRIENFLRLVKCFNCQRHGHIAKNCQSENCCGYCSNNEHSSKDCPNKTTTEAHRCINCIRAKFRETSHHTDKSDCPIYKSKLEQYINSIDYGD